MSEEDKKLMDDLVEERIELKKKRDKLNGEIFELDRKIHMIIDIRVKGEIDKKEQNG